MHSIKSIAGAVVVTGSLCAGSAWSAPIVFSGSGAAATRALNDFRTAIGGVKNTAAPQSTGRREINWDGVKLDGTDANPNTQVVDANKTVIIPVDHFQNQGTLFADPYAVGGNGFAIFSRSRARGRMTSSPAFWNKCVTCFTMMRK